MHKYNEKAKNIAFFYVYLEKKTRICYNIYEKNINSFEFLPHTKGGITAHEMAKGVLEETDAKERQKKGATYVES